METKKIYFVDCHLADCMYHEADEFGNDLEVGTVLQLQRYIENRHDADAVAVVYLSEEDDDNYNYCIR